MTRFLSRSRQTLPEMESDGPSPQHYSIAGEFDKYAQEADLRKSIDKSRQVLRQLWDQKKSYLAQSKID